MIRFHDTSVVAGYSVNLLRARDQPINHQGHEGSRRKALKPKPS